MATEHARVPVEVKRRAEDVKDEYGFPTLGEAIRHMCQEGGYDV
jgi:antitoxin component of RelBE/YafQ-DinJ toxin-antitoxin module